MSGIRIANVGYLNSAPFNAALRRLVACRIDTFVPADLPRVWAAGVHDLCLLSTIDGLRSGLLPLEGATISADGPVGSVLLCGDGSPNSWRRVAADPASSTSNELARIILESRASRPSFLARRESRTDVDSRCATDAEVIIGDRALLVDTKDYDTSIDLSLAWRESEGLPFVFAYWVRGRSSRVSRPTLESLLSNASVASARETRECVDAHARVTGLAPDLLTRYLSERISYRFGTRERQGLARFADRSVDGRGGVQRARSRSLDRALAEETLR
jgi:predicted solute-binding protein